MLNFNFRYKRIIRSGLKDDSFLRRVIEISRASIYGNQYSNANTVRGLFTMIV